MNASNPYWEIVKDYPDGNADWPWEKRWQPTDYHLIGSDDLSDRRQKLAQQYSWALPHPRAVQWLADLTRNEGIVEIGAGRGYWANLLSQEGVDVTCYDLYVPDEGNNDYHPGGTTFHPVLQGGPEKAALHTEKTLLLCWPPYWNSNMAYDTLKAYQGEHLAYIGEGQGGCTANDAFFDLLHEEWDPMEECEDHTSWYGINDRMRTFLRKK